MFYQETFAGIDLIRNYVVEVPAENDFLLVTVDNKLFGRMSSGFFRLKSGFIASGEVDDGVRILESTVLTDWYWKRVCQGVLEVDNMVVEVVQNQTYTLTHRADAGNTRIPTITRISTVAGAAVFDASGINTFSPTDTDIFTLTGTPRKIPIDLTEAATTGAKLPPRYNITKNYDVVLTGYTPIAFSDKSRAHFGGQDGRIHLQVDNYQGLLSLKDDAGTWIVDHRYTGYLYDEVVGCGTSLITARSLGIFYANDPINVYILDDATGTLISDGTIGINQDWICKCIAKPSADDSTIFGSFEQMEDGWWGQYIASITDWIQYEKSGGEWTYPGARPDPYHSGQIVAQAERGDWRYNEASHKVMSSFGSSWNWIGWNTAGNSGIEGDISVTNRSYGLRTPIGGSDDGRIVFLFATPASEHYVGVWTGGSYWNPVITDPMFPYYLSGTSFDITSIINDHIVVDGIVWKFNAANEIIPIADVEDMTFPTGWDTPLAFHAIQASGADLIATKKGAGDCWHCSLDTVADYESAGFVIRNFIDAASSITLVAISVVEPANTRVRFLLEEKLSETLYKWTGATWVVNSDYNTGNTAAELGAADYSLLKAVGLDFNLHVAMYSDDGTATPTFVDASITSSSGVDRELSEAFHNYLGQFEIKIVSSTQTSFKYLAATTYTFDLGVAFLT